MPEQDLITQLLRDLKNTVDELPNRHEIDAIVERLDQRIESNKAAIDGLKTDTEELKRGRIPSWLAPVGTALSTVFAGGALYVALSNGHPNAQAASALPTLTPIVQPQGHK